MAKRNSLRRYAAGLAAVLALAGCQAEAAPGPEPTSTSATQSPEPTAPSTPATRPSTSAAPTTSAAGQLEIPGLPDAAKHRTAEGANAFVRYYFEQLNEAYREPNPALVGSFGTKTCKSCKGLADTPAKLRQNGDRLTGDRHDKFVIQGFGENLPTDPRYTVSAQMEQTGAKIENVATGRIVQTDVRKTVWFAVHLVWTDDGWRIDSIQAVDDGLGDNR